jgi:hypothetical protein
MNKVTLTTNANPIVYDISEYANYHTLKMPPIHITSVNLGENVNAYGNTIMNYNGINQTKYFHFTKGNTYVLEPPVMFLTFHIDKNVI